MSTVNTTAGFISGTGFSSQCFPVRSLTRYKRQDEDGKKSSPCFCQRPITSLSVGCTTRLAINMIDVKAKLMHV